MDISKSSQFLSALLISAACAKKPVKINPVGSHGLDYVNMTLDMMWSFGLTVKEGDGYIVCGGYSAKKYDIEPDVSAACYFYAMNKILGAEISVNGVMPHSMQGDIKFIKLLENFDGGKVDMHEFSDQTLTLAAIAPYLGAPTEICGVAHIRGQECDRIAAIVKNLTAMGVKCEERADGVKIYPSQPKPAKIETFGDHRVAMAFALTGLRADGIEIENPEVCSKTFKNYFEVLDGLCAELFKIVGIFVKKFRVMVHMERIVIHSDLNNFYASVERRLNPELAGKPVAVCGSKEERRGIVLAKCEIAKRFGVKTGDTIFAAQKKCPNIVIVPPHFEEYMNFSRAVKSIYARYTDLIEGYGIDECWLDVTHSTRIFPPFADMYAEADGERHFSDEYLRFLGDTIRNTVKSELGVTVSCGVSFNKAFAKLGSDLKNPTARRLFPS